MEDAEKVATYRLGRHGFTLVPWIPEHSDAQTWSFPRSMYLDYGTLNKYYKINIEDRMEYDSELLIQENVFDINYIHHNKSTIVYWI